MGNTEEAMGLGCILVVVLGNIAWWSFIAWAIYKLVTHFTA